MRKGHWKVWELELVGLKPWPWTLAKNVDPNKGGLLYFRHL